MTEKLYEVWVYRRQIPGRPLVEGDEPLFTAIVAMPSEQSRLFWDLFCARYPDAEYFKGFIAL